MAWCLPISKRQPVDDLSIAPFVIFYGCHGCGVIMWKQSLCKCFGYKGMIIHTRLHHNNYTYYHSSTLPEITNARFMIYIFWELYEYLCIFRSTGVFNDVGSFCSLVWFVDKRGDSALHMSEKYVPTQSVYTIPCFGFCKCGSQRRESMAFEDPLISWTWHGLVNKVIIEGWMTYVTQRTHDSRSSTSTEYRIIFFEWNNSFVFVGCPKKGRLVPCPADGFFAFHHSETDVWAMPSVIALNCHGNSIHHHMLSPSRTPYHHHARVSSPSLPS